MTYVAVIETAGNQRYIFSTNRVREQVGASELIHRVGTTWVMEATGNRPLDVLMSTSGKAVLRGDDRSELEDVIWAVTSRALVEAPGLVVHAAIHAVEGVTLGAAVAAAYRQLPAWNPHVGRFGQQPPLEICMSSGGVGQHVVQVGSRSQVVSAEVSAKRGVCTAGLDRMLPDVAARNLGVLEDEFEADRFAVVHADGNGLGRIFLNLDRLTDSDEDYARWSRELSEGVATCARSALSVAMSELGNAVAHSDPGFDGKLPVVPIVVGGDDVTLVCDARYGLRLAESYLQAFQAATAASTQLDPILRAAIEAGHIGGDPDRPVLTASAGVAVVKAHHPFWAAYELAAELTDSAKAVKRFVRSTPNNIPWPVSSLDVHVLLDSRTDGLEPARAKMHLDGGRRLWGGPWLIGTTEMPPSQCNVDARWWEDHQYSRLVSAIALLSERDDDAKRILPSSQVHQLRTALTTSPSQAEECFRRLLGRFPSIDRLGDRFSVFCADGGSLVLDAMALENLL